MFSFSAITPQEKEYAYRLVHHVPCRAPEESPAVLREEPPKAD